MDKDPLGSYDLAFLTLANHTILYSFQKHKNIQGPTNSTNLYLDLISSISQSGLCLFASRTQSLREIPAGHTHGDALRGFPEELRTEK